MADFPDRVQGGRRGFCESLKTHSFCIVPLTDEESDMVSNVLEQGKFLFVDPLSQQPLPNADDLINSCLTHRFSCGTRDTWFTGFKALKQRQVTVNVTRVADSSMDIHHQIRISISHIV